MEKPILFSTPMVRAILEGRKTQTRRVVKPQPCHEVIKIWKDTQDPPRYHFQAPANDCVGETISTPKYMRGDTLYVRETYFKNAPGGATKYFYKADEQPEEVIGQMGAFGYRWRPSIHMPREAARIWLTVKDVRVERLQDISEDDARAEGAVKAYPTPEGDYVESYRDGFAAIWRGLNNKPNYVWQNNPLVWVIEYAKACAECLGCPHDHDKVACELAGINYFDAQEGKL